MSKARLALQAGLVGVLGLAVLGSTIALSGRDYEFFDPLIDIKSIIVQRYVDAPDESAMQRAAIEGMISSLQDPYTEYVPPADRRSFDRELTGDFVGIGVQVVVRDGWLTVVTPLEDTPAFRQGIMAEDRIVEISGVSTFQKTAEECVELLTGASGTPVNLVIERSGERIPIALVRERIVARTVKGFHWESAAGDERNQPGAAAGGEPVRAAQSGGKAEAEEGGGRWKYIIDPSRRIAYIRLTQFTPTSAEELEETLRGIGADQTDPARGLGGLVLDLRWNPGGVLQDAVAMADLFIADGTIVSTKGRAHRDQAEQARAEGTLPQFPMVVLVNGQSASASEVLAGALSENGRAIAVGTRTFGKGLVQSVLSLPTVPGAQLKVTEQRYYLPSGRSIHRKEGASEWGVDPSPGFAVPMTDREAIDLIQVRRQEEVIRRGPAPAGPGAGVWSEVRSGAGAGSGAGAATDWSDPESIAARLKDPQLAAAVRAVQLKIDGGAWTPTGQAVPEGTAVAAEDLTRARDLRDRMVLELTRLDRRIDSLEQAAGAAAEAASDAQASLWPADVDLTGGSITIVDRAGRIISTLSITGTDLQRWLAEADVRRVDPPSPSADQAPDQAADKPADQPARTPAATGMPGSPAGTEPKP